MKSLLVGPLHEDENCPMKALATILVAAAVAYAVFDYYFQKMPTTNEGTAPTQAITLTGVRAGSIANRNSRAQFHRPE